MSFDPRAPRFVSASSRRRAIRTCSPGHSSRLEAFQHSEAAHGRVQLLDFGIAKILKAEEARETELTRRLGGRALTPDYASPEQIAGAPISTAADVYSLGVMLYELATGMRPYRLPRDSRAALEEAILSIDPIPPSRQAITQEAAGARSTTPKKLARSLKGDLDTIIGKALKKSALERYATADAFEQDLERYLRGEAVLAQRDRWTYRTRKFARRYRIAIAASSILVLTLAAGLVATTYEARVASSQRDTALQAQLRSLTQAAGARLTNDDVSGALGIIIEVLPHQNSGAQYLPEALSVFQEGRAMDRQILALTGHRDVVRSAVFSPDSRHLVTASSDGTVRIWDAATGLETVQLSGHNGVVRFATFSPDGNRIVSASDDKTVRLWDAQTGQPILLLRGHTDAVISAAFSPDGSRIVTASVDKSVRIWDAELGREMRRLEGHTGPVRAAAFSPDGKLVLTASVDKTARLWDAATGEPLRSFSGHTGSVNWATFFARRPPDRDGIGRRDGAGLGHGDRRPDLPTQRAYSSGVVGRLLAGRPGAWSRPPTTRPHESGMRRPGSNSWC